MKPKPEKWWGVVDEKGKCWDVIVTREEALHSVYYQDGDHILPVLVTPIVKKGRKKV